MSGIFASDSFGGVQQRMNRGLSADEKTRRTTENKTFFDSRSNFSHLSDTQLKEGNQTSSSKREQGFRKKGLGGSFGRLGTTGGKTLLGQ